MSERNFAWGVAVLGASLVSCLSRPVVDQHATRKMSHTNAISNKSIDKVDLLFMIDNSTSMGDKQEMLGQAVPDLVDRLVNPLCVDGQGVSQGQSKGGACPAGQSPEFAPVHDMHLGIVSSSLGGRGSKSCPASAKSPTNDALNRHNDDKAHLVNRVGANEVPSDGADTSNLLAWFPTSNPANAGKEAPSKPIIKAAALRDNFQEMVKGVHEFGCGYEHQLEAVYRFLMQPDPYESVTLQPTGASNAYAPASLTGIDAVLLKQRADFLRPDSLLAVVVITDENESDIDPVALNGYGYLFLENNSDYAAPRATEACATDPVGPKCMSCENEAAKNDPNCKVTGGKYPREEDQGNTRLFHMKERFGVNPQFPIQRYIDGFTSRTVPNRLTEHDSNGNYDGTVKPCTNPIFAQSLPREVPANESDAINKSLCTLEAGPRTPDQVYFLAITGVPWDLLTVDAKATPPVFKSALSDSDWVKIVGQDPLNYNFTGVDPRMVESISPRPDVPKSLGLDFATKGNDFQYACTFKLQTPRNCGAGVTYSDTCDCGPGADNPLCDPSDPTMQVRGKAYPCISELSLARALKNQAVVSSICGMPEEKTADAPHLSGYRPAMATLVDRLRATLAPQCLAEKLDADADGNIPCLLLEVIGTDGPESECTKLGRKIPSETTQERFRQAQKLAGNDVSKKPVCEIEQILNADTTISCESSDKTGWCYVTGGAAGNCPQAIKFSASGSPKPGATTFLQCIKSTDEVAR